MRPKCNPTEGKPEVQRKNTRRRKVFRKIHFSIGIASLKKIYLVLKNASVSLFQPRFFSLGDRSTQNAHAQNARIPRMPAMLKHPNRTFQNAPYQRGETADQPSVDRAPTRIVEDKSASRKIKLRVTSDPRLAEVKFCGLLPTDVSVSARPDVATT